MLFLAGLMFIASNIIWIERPVFSGIKAYNVYIIPAFKYSLSFGVLGVLLSVLLLISIFMKNSFWKIWSGIGGIIISILFFGNVAFLDPVRFNAISEEVESYRYVMNFSLKFLPPNIGIEPAYIIGIKPEQALDRFMFTLHIMGWGWYLFFASSVLWVIITGSSNFIKKELIYIIPVLLLSIIPMVPYTLSKYYIGKASANWVNGNYNKAIEEFEFVRKIAPAIEYSKFYNINLGRMYKYLGRKGNYYYYLYSGTVYAEEMRTKEAEDAFSMALSMSYGTPSETVIKNIYSDYLIKNGIIEFRKKRFSNAIEYLSNATYLNPNNFMAQYILSKVLYDSSQFEQAITINKYILDISINPLLNANVYANMGDCYSKLGELNTAREFYEQSMKLDRSGNFRATQELGGT